MLDKYYHVHLFVGQDHLCHSHWLFCTYYPISLWGLTISSFH
nr:MAG TPA: hypothetical protein [Caudoviricetes sp.]